MKVLNLNASTIQIIYAAELDTIQVTWVNYQPGRGDVTITCYGQAWTCYFNAMSGKTIQQFFREADTAYMVNALQRGQFLKQNKAHAQYLAKIVNAIKDAIQKEAK